MVIVSRAVRGRRGRGAEGRERANLTTAAIWHCTEREREREREG